MTTTPTFWKTQFQLNFNAAGGVQVAPIPIGLANGGMIAGWLDNSFGPSPGDDITAQLFDTQANKIGGFTQLNTISTTDGERMGDMEPLPGGGFVVAYNSDDDVKVTEVYASGVVLSTSNAGDGRVNPAVSIDGGYHRYVFG